MISNAPSRSDVLRLGLQNSFRESKVARFRLANPLEVRRSNKSRKSRPKFRDEIRFSFVGVHMPIFGEKSARYQWCQAVRRATKGTGLECRPFSRGSHCEVILCCNEKKICFLEFLSQKKNTSLPPAFPTIRFIAQLTIAREKTRIPGFHVPFRCRPKTRPKVE